MRCVAAKMSLGLVIAAPDAAEKFTGGGGRLEDRWVLPKATDLEGHTLYKRERGQAAAAAAAGGQREASSSI